VADDALCDRGHGSPCVGATANLLKNAVVAFFNFANWEAELPTAHKKRLTSSFCHRIPAM
jgi:hypothetical protein